MQEIDFHRVMARPGTIIDAGAHEGRLTVSLAALPGARVIAFETVAAGIPTAPGGCGGTGDASAGGAVGPVGTAVLSVPLVGGVAQEEWASIAKDYRIRPPGGRACGWGRSLDRARDPLDSLELTDVTALKIDVEGAEEEALRGALGTLRRCRPVLSIEIEERHRAGSTLAVPALLRPLGYRGFFEFYGEWRPIETLDVTTMQKGSASPAAFEVSHPYVFGFYFVGEERVGDLAALARLG